jgi:hypothetical protein
MATMKASDIDLSKISLSAVKTLSNGGKQVYLNYNGGMSPLYISTPEVDVPFEMKYFADGDNKGGKYSVSFSMKDLDSNLPMNGFHSKFLELDEFIKDNAIKNSMAWLKQPKVSRETIETLFTPTIKVHTDPETGEPTGKYPDRFGFKIVRRDDKVQCQIYDTKKKYFDVNGETDNPDDINQVITKGSKIKVVLKCNGIWLANGKFGCSWRAEQVRVKVPEGGLTEFAILSDDEDEVGDEEVKAPTTMIEDTDEEDEEDETVEPSPPPQKPKKKTRKVKVKGDN